jgi:hypothetical protein
MLLYDDIQLSFVQIIYNFQKEIDVIMYIIEILRIFFLNHFI